ncbi:hypothetical protein PWT90_07288 [Aphanocladium album]|nr:hypothetical protein PWT90_07288 [Aphanocladium album]
MTSLRWRCVGDSLNHGNTWPPPEVLQYVQAGTTLHVDNLPLRMTTESISMEYTEEIPANALQTLHMAGGLPPLVSCLAPLKQILLRATNLQTFHYRNYGRRTTLEFCEGEKLPPLRTLVLNSYFWNHSVEDARKHWDFSRIKSLRLTAVPLRAFLSSVSMADFINLHTLQLEDRNFYTDDDEAGKATDLMSVLIRDHIHALTTLDITCDIRRLPVEVITQHGESLQHLRLRDNMGFEEDDGTPCPTLPASALAILADGLPHVRTLELDMDTTTCDPIEFLEVVSGFHKLRHLTLHTQAVGAPSGCASPSYKPAFDDGKSATTTHDAALCTALGFLSNILKGHSITFREESGAPLRLLKRVTVNFGGWRPVLLRRVAATWRLNNLHGIYAERCFVFEREDFQKSFSVTELMAKEPRVVTLSPLATDLDRPFPPAMIGVC